MENEKEEMLQEMTLYRISDFVLEVHTDHSVKMVEGFAPFRPAAFSLTEDPDLTVDIRKVPCIPDKNGKRICKKTSFDIVQEGASQVYYFHGSGRSDEAYAVRTKPDPAHISIRYREGWENHFSDESNVFFHIRLEDLLYPFARMILHASCIRTGFGGILFSGPSGIGKSTQAALWKRFRKAEEINGDKPVLRRMEDGTWRAYGSPYAGSSRIYKNESVPVRAVIFLKQGRTGMIHRLDTWNAFRNMWRNTIVDSWDPGFVSDMIGLVEKLSTEVPAYQMVCQAKQTDVDLLAQTLEHG